MIKINMKKLNNYIIEKLHLNKNIKLNDIPTKDEFINKLEEYINSLDNANNLDLKNIWPDTFDKDRPKLKDKDKRSKKEWIILRIWTRNNILLASYGNGVVSYNYDFFTDEQKLLIYNYITKELEKHE